MLQCSNSAAHVGGGAIMGRAGGDGERRAHGILNRDGTEHNTVDRALYLMDDKFINSKSFVYANAIGQLGFAL